MNLLEMNHIKKSFEGGLEVIKDISLCVKEGEVVSIIGPSGSGKSTLLRCATMLEKIDSGELIYLGQKVARNDAHLKSVYVSSSEKKKFQKYYGLVFQNFHLFPHFNVLKNIIDAPQRVLKQSKKEAEKKGLALLEQLGLSDKKDAYPYQLSGGQQQRVSIARALAMDPKILFFDEPTSALDPELTGEVQKVIQSLAKEHMTMIIVTHEMQFAKKISDRIIFMEKRKIHAEGTPEEIFGTDNERIREFIGRLQNE